MGQRCCNNFGFSCCLGMSIVIAVKYLYILDRNNLSKTKSDTKDNRCEYLSMSTNLVCPQILLFPTYGESQNMHVILQKKYGLHCTEWCYHSMRSLAINKSHECSNYCPMLPTPPPLYSYRNWFILTMKHREHAFLLFLSCASLNHYILKTCLFPPPPALSSSLPCMYSMKKGLTSETPCRTFFYCSGGCLIAHQNLDFRLLYLY